MGLTGRAVAVQCPGSTQLLGEEVSEAQVFALLTGSQAVPLMLGQQPLGKRLIYVSANLEVRKR